jgi:RNA polymerase sigma-70 factor (ECF subfamily)
LVASGEPTAVPDEDAALVRSAVGGDNEAFAELVSRHKGTVLRRAARFARNHADLEDLGQETFLRAYRDLRSFRGDAPFGHWLSRIAVRVCYDALRKRRGEEKDVSLEVLAYPLADPSTGNGTSAQLARIVLDRAMSRLKPEDRLVITLYELEDRSVREVAELTGWSETRVKVRAFRARQALKRWIGGDDER